MNDTLNNSTCGRADDLISFLYGELKEVEGHDFKKHLQTCQNCQTEFASFGEVRNSIELWKTEALHGIESEPVTVPRRHRSAVVALREFFDLSPLWMKAAIGFATVVFCAMVVLLIYQTQSQSLTAVVNNEAKYSEQQMKEAIAKALADQAKRVSVTDASRAPKELGPTVPQRNRRGAPPNRAAQWASRKPLSKSERQQLASDLRLLSTRDEDTLNLITDRINQEF